MTSTGKAPQAVPATADDGPQPAQTVGNQFVSQYYTVLHASPKHLHRFYSDRSTLTHADVRPDGGSMAQEVTTASGQKMIHETVMAMGYEDTLTEIYSVDAQYSVDGAVIVMVTGALQVKEKPKRPFVQTFFLAVQEKGYYVLNDVFRYLTPGGAPQTTAAAETPVVAVKQDATAAKPAQPPPATTTTTTTNTTATKSSPVNGVPVMPPSYTGGVHTVPSFGTMPARVPGPASSGSSGHSTAPGSPAKEPSTPSGSLPRSSQPSTNGSTKGNNAAVEAFDSLEYAPTEGVFIRDIPSQITVEELTEKLVAFGPLKASGPTLKYQKGRDSYAFADFEDIEAAKQCISQGFELGGRRVLIAAKRPDVFRKPKPVPPPAVVPPPTQHQQANMPHMMTHMMQQQPVPQHPYRNAPHPNQYQQRGRQVGGPQQQQQQQRSGGPMQGMPQAYAMPAGYGTQMLVPMGMHGMHMPMAAMAMPMSAQQMQRAMQEGYSQQQQQHGGGRGRGRGGQGRPQQQYQQYQQQPPSPVAL